MPSEQDPEILMPNTVASSPGGIEVDNDQYDRCFPGRPLLREQFRIGCVNPGVVVSLNPYYVAVFTDLSHQPSVPPCRVIKIVEQPLALMTGGPPQLRQRLSTIALYWSGPRFNEGRWETFDPIVANCVSTHNGDILRVFNQISEEDWRELEFNLEKVPKPYQANVQCYIDLPPGPRAVEIMSAETITVQSEVKPKFMDFFTSLFRPKE